MGSVAKCEAPPAYPTSFESIPSAYRERQSTLGDFPHRLGRCNHRCVQPQSDDPANSMSLAECVMDIRGEEVSFTMIEEEERFFPLPVPEESFHSTCSFPVSSYNVTAASLCCPLRIPSRHVGFVGSPTHSVHRSECSVQPYSEVYGSHPALFDFDRFGNKVPRSCHSSVPERDEFPRGNLPGGRRNAGPPRAHRSQGTYMNDGMFASPTEWGRW